MKEFDDDVRAERHAAINFLEICDHAIPAFQSAKNMLRDSYAADFLTIIA
jgi:hypothetical protein